MKTYTQLIEELAEAKGRLVPHEVLTNIKKKRTPKTKRRIADAKETLARKTSGRTNLNDPPDVLGAEVAKQKINAIRAGSTDTDSPIRQGWNTFKQKLKKGKYTDAQVGGTRYDTPQHRG